MSCSVRTLDQAAARRIVPGGRQAEGRTVLQVELALHEPLAERGLADDQSPVPILHRTGDDLARRGGPVVHQHHQGNVRKPPGARGNILVVEFRPPSFGVDDLPPLRHQLVDHLERLLQVPAGIPAQIEDEPLHPGGAQLGHRLEEFIVCLRRKPGHGHVARLAHPP